MVFASCATAADASAAPGHKHEATVINSFTLLANARIRKCTRDSATVQAVRGWRNGPAVCAWQNRLQMRRWEAPAQSTAMHCISAPAVWWSWSQARVAAGVVRSVWHSNWTAQSLIDETYLSKRIAVIEKHTDGSWTATEWSWLPASASRIRKKEERQWNMLRNAAGEMAGRQPVQAAFDDAALLRKAWERYLMGRPAEVSPAEWLWEEGGRCLRMESAAAGQPQLHLPYAKEDVRREQRSAMQLRLARNYPNATWLTPFHVLPAPDRRAGSGVRYEAVWIEGQVVRGQLWMPRKDNGALLHLRIAVAVNEDRSGKAAAAVPEVADLVHRELSALGEAWSADHEQ